ncbi:MAG TPA: steroid Delta-isomerase [Nevskiaceae bacterium]|nr:steroid Delta-isomerase [Nevskiaceae bacterium]
MTEQAAREQKMKQTLQSYLDLFNRADAAAIAELYAQDATVEDPVGSPVKHGRPEIARFYGDSVKTKAQLKLAAPIRASHANEAAMAFDVELNMPTGRAVIHVIDTMRFNDAGQIVAMRAFWGPSDMQIMKA